MFGASRGEGGLDRPLRLIGLLPKRRPLRWIELRDSRQQLAADLAVAAPEVFDLDRFQPGAVVCLRDCSGRAVANLRRLAHAHSLRPSPDRVPAPAPAPSTDCTPRPLR